MNTKQTMSTTKTICRRGLLGAVELALLVVGLFACVPTPPGTMPPSSSKTPDPTQTCTPVPMLQPMPFPTPGEIVMSWTHLITPASIEDMAWTAYRGEIAGTDKSIPWNFSVEYPAEWYPCNPNTPEYVCIQSIPQANYSSPIGFVKFEIVSQDQPPSLPDNFPPEKGITVTVAGEPGMLIVHDMVPGTLRVLILSYERRGRWLTLAGTINLLGTDEGLLARHTDTLLYMMSSFSVDQ
jgi:hypothetical protein